MENLFLRPALLPGMAPELLTVYESAMDTANDATVEPRSQGRSARARQPSATPVSCHQPVLTHRHMLTDMVTCIFRSLPVLLDLLINAANNNSWCGCDKGWLQAMPLYYNL